MYAIVYGGAGFLGSHIADRLKLDGITPIVFDNLSRGNLGNIKGHEWRRGRLIDCLNEEKPEYLFHFAATNGTNNFYEKPLEVLINNCEITSKLFSIIDSADHKPKVIYASSSEVYGEPVIPTKETECIKLSLNDRDSYASSKAIGEYYTRLYCRDMGIDYLILRIFNVYGGRDSLGHVIPDLNAKIAVADSTLDLIGEGTETRSFCHIDDFINMIFVLLGSDGWNTEYNIGNPEETCIIEVARRLMELHKRDLKIVTSERLEGDRLRRCPDISKLLSVIGSYDFMSLREGLKRC